MPEPLTDDLDQDLDDKADVIVDDDAPADPAVVDDDGEADDDDKPLGPKGQKALDAIKAKLKTERERRRAAEAKLGEGKPAEQDDDQDATRRVEQAATARANERILKSEIRAVAAGKFSDPKDALRFLDLGQFEVGPDGDVDEDEIAEAIDDLLKRKPYLAAAQSAPKRFQGGADQGARSPAKAITEEQLQAMTPTEIDKAYAEGKLAHLL